jgi:hypothetical protein
MEDITFKQKRDTAVFGRPLFFAFATDYGILRSLVFRGNWSLTVIKGHEIKFAILVTLMVLLIAPLYYARILVTRERSRLEARNASDEDVLSMVKMTGSALLATYVAIYFLVAAIEVYQ